MEIKLFTLFPERPKEFLDFATTGLSLPPEEAFKLYFLSLRVSLLSEIPFYAFLERTLCNLKLDELKKKEYLLTLSVHTLRELLREHFDLKFTKNLYLSLRERLPSEFFKGCAPRHEVVLSQDVSFELMEASKKAELPPFLKVRHIVFPFHFKGDCEELMGVLPELTLYALRRVKEGLYEIYAPLSISEMIYLTQRLTTKKILKKIEAQALTNQLKSLFPDCFGES